LRRIPQTPSRLRGSESRCAARSVACFEFETAHGYLVSLCAVCFRQKRQYFASSSRSVVFFLFFVVL
jgi:hypothetical protein